MIRSIKLYGTTDASGDLTVTAANKVTGELIAIHWIDGDLADGVDAVLSDSRDGDEADVTLLTLTDANSDAMYYPRTPAQDNAGADVTYDGTNEIYTEQIVNGKPKLVVSSGGNAKTGGCIVFVKE